MERCCGWYSYLYSVSYLTLTVGDKGIKCPFASSKQCRKGPSGTPPFAMMAILSAPFATAYPWLHSLSPRTLGIVPERHVGGCAGAWVRSGSLPRQSALPPSLSGRVRKLARRCVLPGRVARRGKVLEMPWLASPASSS